MGAILCTVAVLNVYIEERRTTLFLAPCASKNGDILVAESLNAAFRTPFGAPPARRLGGQTVVRVAWIPELRSNDTHTEARVVSLADNRHPYTCVARIPQPSVCPDETEAWLETHEGLPYYEGGLLMGCTLPKAIEVACHRPDGWTSATLNISDFEALLHYEP